MVNKMIGENKMKKSIHLLILILITSSSAFSGVLTWLNPPEFDIGYEGNSADSTSYLGISANGQYVTFVSTSSNLVANDTNGTQDYYVKNLDTEQITIINTDEQGVFLPSYSVGNTTNPTNDGKFIAFTSSADSLPFPSNSITAYHLYIKDIETNAVHTLLYNGTAVVTTDYQIHLSSDGLFFYFTTDDSLAANDLNTTSDVYVYDKTNATYELISIDSNGFAAGFSTLLSVSNNGRFINFESNGDVLPVVNGLTGTFGFIRDLDFSTTNIYTVDNLDVPVADSLDASEVSNNGVTYFCSSSDLIDANDNNGLNDLFVYDAGIVTLFPFPNMATGISDFGCDETTKINVSNNNSKFYLLHQSNQIVPPIISDGNKVMFINLTTQQSFIVSQVNNEGFEVLNLNASDNLSDIIIATKSTVGLATIQSTQIKAVHFNNQTGFDVISKAVTPPQIQNSSIGGGHISHDLNWVAYMSNADNIVPRVINENSRDLYLKNRNTGVINRIGYELEYEPYGFNAFFSMSSNGRYSVFRSNYSQDASHTLLDNVYLFLYDNFDQSHTQIASSCNSPKVNNDGNVVFSSTNGTLVANDNGGRDVFIYDKVNATIQIISVNDQNLPANNLSETPDIGGSGVSTWIVFSSRATDLIANDNNNMKDVFMVNWPSGQISRISEITGVGGDLSSDNPRISSDTTTITFETKSSNLIGAAATSNPQVMVYDRVLNSLNVISYDYLGGFAGTYINNPMPSANGRFIAFHTTVKVVINDTNNDFDIYVFDRQTNQMTRISQYQDGTDYDTHSILYDLIVDDSQNPPLINVLFYSQNHLINNYFGLNIPPISNQQLYLMQSGGTPKSIQLDITGNGEVVDNIGFNCITNCSQTYELGQSVTLTATANSGSAFMHWQGDECNNSSNLNCTVYINDNKSIQAIFATVTDTIFNNGFEN